MAVSREVRAGEADLKVSAEKVIQFMGADEITQSRGQRAQDQALGDAHGKRAWSGGEWRQRRRVQRGRRRTRRGGVEGCGPEDPERGECPGGGSGHQCPRLQRPRSLRVEMRLLGLAAKSSSVTLERAA